jgi:TonB family protein
MKRAVIAAFLATAASAQDRDPPRYVPPASTGAPHVCNERYPQDAARDGVEGKTLLRFTITENGHIKDIAIDTTSGSAALDQASIDCAKDWTYSPAMRSGVAMAVPWRVSINWFLHDTFEGPAAALAADDHWVPPQPVPGDDHGCEVSFGFIVGRETHTSPTGPSVVQFTITPEGTTRDYVVSRSSGSEPYDDEAVKCIRVWRYIPANRDGVPVSARWSATIPWRSARK